MKKNFTLASRNHLRADRFAFRDFLQERRSPDLCL